MFVFYCLQNGQVNCFWLQIKSQASVLQLTKDHCYFGRKKHHITMSHSAEIFHTNGIAMNRSIFNPEEQKLKKDTDRMRAETV